MRTATAQILAQEGIQQGRGGGWGPPTGPPTNLLAAMRCSNNSEQLGRVSEAASTNGTTAAGRPPLPPDRPRLQTLLVSAAVPPAAPPLCSSNCVALALRSRPPLARVTSVAPRSVGALFFCGPNLCSVDLASCCRPHASLRRCVAAAARRVGTSPAPVAQRCPPSCRPRHIALAVPSPTWAPQPAALPPLIEFLSEVGVALRRPFREAGRLDPVMGLFFAASPRRVRATAT